MIEIRIPIRCAVALLAGRRVTTVTRVSRAVVVRQVTGDTLAGLVAVRTSGVTSITRLPQMRARQRKSGL